MKIGFPIDFAKLEAVNFRLQNLSSAPSSPALGQMYLDTDDNLAYFWNGSSWVGWAAMTAADILAALLTVDGSGSGLDADLLDGHSSAYFATQAALDTDVQNLADHIADTSDAHDASAISFSPASGIAATDVQAAIQEVVSDLQAYADALAQGLSPKMSVRVATTAAGTLASSFENGDTVDGITLATGDRILIKDQAAGAENGIYTVNASGAPTRATDMDSNTEVRSGLFTFVEEGTTNADSGWVLTTDGAVVLGTTSLAFAQFSGAGQITAGAALSKTGNTLDVNVDGSTIEVNSDAVRVKDGGITAAKLAAAVAGAGLTGGAGSALAVGAGTGIVVNADDVAIDPTVVARKYTALIGDGSTTSIVVTHNLNNQWAQGLCIEVATLEDVLVDIDHTSANTMTFIFAVAPASNAYRVSIIG